MFSGVGSSPQVLERSIVYNTLINAFSSVLFFSLDALIEARKGAVGYVVQVTVFDSVLSVKVQPSFNTYPSGKTPPP